MQESIHDWSIRGREPVVGLIQYDGSIRRHKVGAADTLSVGEVVEAGGASSSVRDGLGPDGFELGRTVNEEATSTEYTRDTPTGR